MKLEIILGIIVVTVFLGGSIFYVNSAKDTNISVLEVDSVEEKEGKFALASEISTPDGFINTEWQPISVAEFKGKKVVLLDIWTYSCINCVRTIPHLNEWYKKYEDQGLVIIGLHTPEFAFEKVQKNVEDAVKQYGIKYPVVLDNDFSTWNAYGNRYWPRKYLVDIDGYIVYDHIGEGGYEETERAIQKALQERSDRLGMDMSITKSIAQPSAAVRVESGKVQSPEIYFGSKRNERLGNGTRGVAGVQALSIPDTKTANTLYLEGSWDITAEYAKNTGPARIEFNYSSKDVYITAGSATGVTVEVYRDDVLFKTVTIKDEKLYTLIDGADYGAHMLRIVIPQAGLQVFTFTFG